MLKIDDFYMRGGTTRNSDRETLGSKVCATAKMLGISLFPWQKYVADVAGEIDPDTGTYFYNQVILTCQRQSGKSALNDTEDTWNAAMAKARRIYYLAQTGKDAEHHFKEYVKQLSSSPLSSYALKPRLSNGGMEQRFKNDSYISPLAATKVAGHGDQMDIITLDEAFSLTLSDGNTILDGVLPTMNTRLKLTGYQPQLWITSTEGTSESTFLNDILDTLRAGDVPAHTAWFDFGIPDDADPEDLKTIYKYHPAAGYLFNYKQLIGFREQFKNNAAGFARAFANRRDLGIISRAIDADLWNRTACQPISPSQLDGRPLVIAAAVDVDATTTSISMGVENQDHTVHTQLLDSLPGTAAAINRIRDLCTTYHAPLIIDPKGPAAALADQFRDGEDIDLIPMTSLDFMTAGQAYVSSLHAGTVRHAQDIELDDSAANSARIWAGDNWKITRRQSLGKTSPLESVILAAWGTNHRTSTVLQLY